MTLAQLPLRTEPLVDEQRFVTLPYQAFLESLAGGDVGTAWTPTFTGLTETGTATITGVYYRISQKLAFFRITITPATDTSAVSGTTYCNNFPLTFANNAVAITLSGSSATMNGVTASDNRIYVATWTTVTTPITIIGIGEVR